MLPPCVPAGTFIVTSPSSVGTRISVPRIARGKLDAHFDLEIRAVALESPVGRDFDDDKKVSRSADPVLLRP